MKIKTHILFGVILLLAFISCKRNNNEFGNEFKDGDCVVRFSVENSVDVGSGTEPIANVSSKTFNNGTTTVRVVVYKRVGADADFTVDKHVATATYKVKRDGTLTACNVDNDGTENATGSTPTEMHLRSDMYDFYAYSPARALEGKNKVPNINHGDDFMYVLRSHSVDVSNTAVPLVFNRKCSKVSFAVAPKANVTFPQGLSARKITMRNMADSPIDYLFGGDITPTHGGVTNTHEIESFVHTAGATNDIKVNSTGSGIVLPKSMGNVSFDFALTVNATNSTLLADLISDMVFEKNLHYEFSVVVSEASADLTLRVVPWDNVDLDNPGMGDNNNTVLVGSWTEIDWNDPNLGGGSNAGVSVGKWKENIGWSEGLGTGHLYDVNNSAMLVPNIGSVTFDIDLNNPYRKGIPKDVTALPSSLAGALSARVLWKDVPGNIVASIALDRDKRTMTVKAGNVPGNAVVALYSGANYTGEILWSWHIWVTDYQPAGVDASVWDTDKAFTVDGGQVHSYSGGPWEQTSSWGYHGKVIMDRNLGATMAFNDAPPTTADSPMDAWGLSYQWGRKDALPRVSMGSAEGDIDLIDVFGANTAVPPSITGPTTISASIKSPMTFINGVITSNNDWYNSPDNNLWGNGGAKSIYDPCPKGWKVPKNGTWANFGSNAYQTRFKYYNDGGAWVVTDGDCHITHGRRYVAGSVATWYPAAGYRHPHTGDPVGAGGRGSWWASLPYDLYFSIRCHFSTTTILFIGASGSRADANSVRCIENPEKTGSATDDDNNDFTTDVDDWENPNTEHFPTTD